MPRRRANANQGDCATCTGLCCRYITLPLYWPHAPEDYDWIRWMLSHEGVIVYVDEDGWNVQVATRCSHLTESHRCAIYESRPNLCREYSTTGCDQTCDSLADFGWDDYWVSSQSFEQWLQSNVGAEWHQYVSEQRRLNRQHVTIVEPTVEGQSMASNA